jgi:formate hydrogenlyase subunit 6/NADH:ubiquinone oxidoreductase subunit I
MLKKIIDHLVNKNEQRKIDTEFYPDPVSSRGKDDLPARSRGLLFNEIEKCTGCGNCNAVCPTKCITIDAQVNERNNKTWVTQFDIDFSNCIFCGLCVEVCDPNSLVQTKEIQPAVYQTKDLTMSFGRGKI